MKELSIEEKAKRYDLAIEAAKSVYNNMKEGGNFGGIEDLEVIFPELAESEDKKIRKEILSLIQYTKGRRIGYEPRIDQNKMIDWLEKQEQKPQGKSALEAAKEVKIDNQNCIKLANKVEPKFKVGDWIVGANSVYKIISLNDELNCYIAVTTNNKEVKIPYFFDCAQGHMCSYHLWTIKDAKDGDVLQFKGRPFIYNGYLEEKKYPFAYGGIYLDGSFFVSNGSLPWTHSDVYPATKEQCDILFHEMKEAGYEWNAEKKELKKIEQKSIEWSEEDKRMFGSIRSTLSMYMNNLSLPKEIRNIHKKELKWFDELYDRGLS